MIDLTGKQFGQWKVLGQAIKKVKDKWNDTWWFCECSCTHTRTVRGKNLRNGGSLGCGCSKKRKRLRSFEALYNVLVRDTDRRNRTLSVDLSYEEFLTFVKIKKCHYCKAQVEWAEFNVAGKARHNLDRVDNSKGYSRDNCVVCCKRCNMAKGDRFTYDEWKSIGRLIQTWEK